MRIILSLLLGLLALAPLTACNEQPLYIDGAWVRLSPNPASPSAAYFTIHGGEDDVTLLGILCDDVVRLEMHDSKMAGSMMTMAPIDHVAIAAHKQVKFQPGGKHVMLWNVNARAIANGKLTMTLIFSNGDRILVDAVIQKAGDAAPMNMPDKH